jgi:prepilin-type N-terminal cleavage/methylation domain-containing protein
MRRRRYSAGYTLLELLLVIAILGVVSTLGLRFMYSFNDAWRSVKSRIEMSDTAEAILSSIRKDCAAAVQPSLANQPFTGTSQTVPDERYYGMSFANDTLSFPVEAETGPEGEIRLRIVEYRVDRSGERNALLRTVRQPGAEEEPAPGIVAYDVLKFQVEFLDPATGQWQAEWSAFEAPAAVQAHLTLSDRNWPSEQVALKAVFPIYVQ